jgi:Bacterial Ig-like domain
MNAKIRNFRLGVAGFLTLCLAASAVIVLRGDGPHPRVVAVIPANGAQHFPGGPMEITFSQPMDTASVERSLQVTPGAEGQGAWYGNTLNVQPLGDWRPNVLYHVALTGQVTDDEGRPLHTPVLFSFRVHHITRLKACLVSGVPNICDVSPGYHAPLTRSRVPVGDFAMSTDGTEIAYTESEGPGSIYHLHLLDVTTGKTVQLTHGNRFSDSTPYWVKDVDTFISYQRQPIERINGKPHLGNPQVWTIATSGAMNTPSS